MFITVSNKNTVNRFVLKFCCRMVLYMENINIQKLLNDDNLVYYNKDIQKVICCSKLVWVIYLLDKLQLRRHNPKVSKGSFEWERRVRPTSVICLFFLYALPFYSGVRGQDNLVTIPRFWKICKLHELNATIRLHNFNFCFTLSQHRLLSLGKLW